MDYLTIRAATEQSGAPEHNCQSRFSRPVESEESRGRVLIEKPSFERWLEGYKFRKSHQHSTSVVSKRERQ